MQHRNLQFATCILQLLVFSTANAQPPPQPKTPPAKRLVDRRPFDQIVLNAAAGGDTLEVLPLTLPQRPLVRVPREGSLKVKLLQRPAEEFEVAWTNIARVRVFEELLLDEARRLAAAGKFDEAYDYFSRLSAEYASLPGRSDAISDYLRRNALALYQSNDHDRALAVLLTLYQRNPNYEGMAGAVESVAGQIIERYLREGEYAAARGVLDLWQRQFRGIAAEAAANWQRRFEAAAARQLEEATRLIQSKDYIAARRSVAKALVIWPTLESAPRVLGQIEREYPFVTVGVLETAPRDPKRRIDDWASLRASRLTQPLLTEQIGFGSEGGVYRSPFGEWQLDESGRALTLNAMKLLTPDALARYLLSAATLGDPNFRDDFANLLEGVSITPEGSLMLHLSRVHVRPDALLQIPAPIPTAQFAIADRSPEQTLFAANGSASGGPPGLRAVIEQSFSNDEAALAALLAGDIDVLDRVPPWQIERLREVKGVRLESYRLPTVHVLIPNVSHPLVAKREFRRAICFGIDRPWILERVLLGGAKKPGFEVVSGPFPAGSSLSDPVRYAYNNRITPRPFEPRLAAILATVAWAGLQKTAGKGEEPADVPPIPQLTLAHPNEPRARIACQTIQMQLSREGIPIKLLEFTADELLAGTVDYDLRYAELAVWEPLTDARSLLGAGGLAGDMRSPYLSAALRELDKATNWNDVRARLAELHDIAHHELPVIPLWQTTNYFAYRQSLRGIGETPVQLYQNVNDWSLAAEGNVAKLETASP